MRGRPITQEEQKQIIEFYKACQNIRKTELHFKRANNTIRKIVERKYYPPQRKEAPNLCNDCQRAARFLTYPCPWASEFKEVPGWTAEKVARDYTQDGITEGYYISACPLFMKDDERSVIE